MTRKYSRTIRAWMDSSGRIADFLHILRTRYPIDGADMLMSEWIAQNTHLHGDPFSYKDYEFQREIADDMHPNLACIKCSQIGLTEVQIRKFLGWLKRNRGRKGIFTLPSEKMYRRVSKMRIKPLIESEPVFNLRMSGDQKPSRSMDMYQIDESFGVISGLTEDDATSIDADILFHDELDLSDQRMIALSQSRLQNSDFKITQAFSTPKYPGFGIDARWQISDQHEYVIKCGACNHVQIPIFSLRFMKLPGYKGDENIVDASNDQINAIDFTEAAVVCEKCHRPLDLRDPSKRFWLCTYPGRLIRGRRVRPFSTHRIGIQYIFSQLLNARTMDGVAGWHNTVLGEPYVDAKAQLSEAEIRRTLMSPGLGSLGEDLPYFIGIDVGDVCHLVLGVIMGGEAVTTLIQSVQISKLVETLQGLFATYNIVGGLIDRHPYTPTANEIRDRFHGRILPCEYRGTAAINLVKDEQDNLSHCQVNRTGVLDDVVTAFRTKKVELNGYGADDAIFITHLRNMVREEEPEMPAKWVKLNNEDHFFHAMAFFLAAPRVYEAASDHYNAALTTSVGVFSMDNFVLPTVLHPEFVKPEPAPLSMRARQKASLWLH